MQDELNPFECLLLRAVTALTAERGPEGAHGAPLRLEAKRMQDGRRVGMAAMNKALARLEDRGLLVSWKGGDGDRSSKPTWWGAARPRRFYRLVTSSQ